MSDARILFPQFRDEQADSRYPFADSANLLSVERKLDIGRDTFIDASLYVIDGDRAAYISAITVTPTEVTITIGDAGSKTRATGTYSALSPPDTGIVELFDSWNRPCGMLLAVTESTIENTPSKQASIGLAQFAAWPAEAHTFRPDATQFVASVVIPANSPGVRGLTPETLELLTGDVWLLGDRGIVVRQDGDNIIRFDVIGEPLFQRYLCQTDESEALTTPYSQFNPRVFIRTINGCSPDAYGNFTLTATAHGATDTVLRVFAQDGNIKIDAVGRKVV
jgi:hypothetical protein